MTPLVFRDYWQNLFDEVLVPEDCCTYGSLGILAAHGDTFPLSNKHLFSARKATINQVIFFQAEKGFP